VPEPIATVAVPPMDLHAMLLKVCPRGPKTIMSVSVAVLPVAGEDVAHMNDTEDVAKRFLLEPKTMELDAAVVLIAI